MLCRTLRHLIRCRRSKSSISYVCDYDVVCSNILHRRLTSQVNIAYDVDDGLKTFNQLCSSCLASRRLRFVSALLLLLSNNLFCRIFSDSATDIVRGNDRPYRHIQTFSSYSLLPVPLSAIESVIAPPKFDFLKRCGIVACVCPSI